MESTIFFAVFTLGFSVGMVLGINAYNTEKGLRPGKLLEECEKNLPRDKICILYAKPKGETP